MTAAVKDGLTAKQIEMFRRCCLGDETLLRYKHAEMSLADAICDMALRSLPASELRAGAIEPLQKLWCEAIVQTQDGSSGRMVCDVENLLRYVNERKTALSPAPADQNAALQMPDAIKIRGGTSSVMNTSVGAAPDSITLQLGSPSKEEEAAHAALVAESKALLSPAPAARQGWISVKERLPEGDDKVIVIYNTGNADARGASEVRRIYNTREDGEECFIKYWMPLPEPPAAPSDAATEGGV